MPGPRRRWCRVFKRVAPAAAGLAATFLMAHPAVRVAAAAQSDLDALTAAPTVGDLQTAVTQLQQDYNAVASSAVSADGADWQHAINSLQQTLADASQLADANSSTPDAPNPLNSNASSDQPRKHATNVLRAAGVSSARTFN